MTCRDIQDRLAGGDDRPHGDPAVREHLDGCPTCRAFAERLAAVDAGLGALADVAPSDALVRRTLEGVASAGRERAPLRRAMALLSVAGLVLVASLSVPFLMTMQGVDESAAPPPVDAVGKLRPPARDPSGDGSRTRGRYTLARGPVDEIVSKTTYYTMAQSGAGDDEDDDRNQPENASVDTPMLEQGDIGWTESGRYGRDDRVDGNEATGEDRDENAKAQDAQTQAQERGRLRGEPQDEGERTGDFLYEANVRGSGQDAEKPPQVRDGLDSSGLARQARIVPSFKDGQVDGFRCFGRGCDEWTEDSKLADLRAQLVERTVETPAHERSSDEGPTDEGPADGDRRTADPDGERTAEASRSGLLHFESVPRGTTIVLDGLTVDDGTVDRHLDAGVHQVVLQRDGHRPVGLDVEVQNGEVTTLALLPRANDQSADDVGGKTGGEFHGAFDGGFDETDTALEGLTYLPARGYFANTYLPGDPTLAWLRRSLGDALHVDGRPVALERASQPYAQPFDAPEAEGLAVYLNADRAQLAGPTRFTLQVGLKGSDRNARRRAALDAVLVVDLRAVPGEEERRALWTLADELAARREAGDRFTLVVAGVPRPVRVAAADFDAAAVRRALAEALEERLGSDASGSLGEALAAAWGEVGGAADDAAPLGASVVLLASAAPLGAEADALVVAAHGRALDGVTLSALGVGAGADARGLARLALAGQGRRRLVAGQGDARAVLEAELMATGRVVARAVRLRIRLGEGVRLVEVLGSHPLANVETAQVRAAEQAVDVRLSRTLGIEADRGEDEDGVQIVIPAFYAGDEHVILLDVVADGPGPVADVQVRYKDLVRLDNAVARARLALPATAAAEGPLVLNVRKNRLAYELAVELGAAADALAGGDSAQAFARVDRAATRLQRLLVAEPVLRDDAELRRDAAMLAGYRRVLEDRDAWQADVAVRDHVVRSLTYAGRAKLTPGPSR